MKKNTKKTAQNKNRIQVVGKYALDFSDLDAAGPRILSADGRSPAIVFPDSITDFIESLVRLYHSVKFIESRPYSKDEITDEDVEKFLQRNSTKPIIEEFPGKFIKKSHEDLGWRCPYGVTLMEYEGPDGKKVPCFRIDSKNIGRSFMTEYRSWDIRYLFTKFMRDLIPYRTPSGDGDIFGNFVLKFRVKKLKYGQKPSFRIYDKNGEIPDITRDNYMDFFDAVSEGMRRCHEFYTTVDDTYMRRYRTLRVDLGCGWRRQDNLRIQSLREPHDSPWEMTYSPSSIDYANCTDLLEILIEWLEYDSKLKPLR